MSKMSPSIWECITRHSSLTSPSEGPSESFPENLGEKPLSHALPSAFSNGRYLKTVETVDSNRAEAHEDEIRLHLGVEWA